MPLSQSARIAAVQAPVIPIISRWIADTPGTISLGQGVVAYGPPEAVVREAQRASADPSAHGYGPIEGEPELVAAIEAKLLSENGIAVRPGSRIAVTAGCNLAFMHAMLAILDAGAEVILPVPYYFNHEMAIEMIGGRVVAVATTDDYRLDL